MDEKRPKRRRDKYNPYTISKQGNRFFLDFKDGEGAPHHYEIDRPLFDLFDSFELEDLSFLNEWDRYIEQSDLTEASLNQRAFEKQASVEDTIINAMQMESLRNAIKDLPERQRRRLCMYYYGQMSYEQIAAIENCSRMAVKYTIDKAISAIGKKYF